MYATVVRLHNKLRETEEFKRIPKDLVDQIEAQFTYAEDNIRSAESLK